MTDPEMSPENPCEKCKEGNHFDCTSLRYTTPDQQTCCCNVLVKDAPRIAIQEFDDTPIVEDPDPDTKTDPSVDQIDKLEPLDNEPT